LFGNQFLPLFFLSLKIGFMMRKLLDLILYLTLSIKFNKVEKMKLHTQSRKLVQLEVSSTLGTIHTKRKILNGTLQVQQILIHHYQCQYLQEHGLDSCHKTLLLSSSWIAPLINNGLNYLDAVVKQEKFLFNLT
jgi:hypothetical protein